MIKVLAATVEVCTNAKCERCWCLPTDVGTHATHTTLCGSSGLSFVEHTS